MNNHTLDLEQPTEATPLLSDRQDYGPGTSSSEVSLEVEPAVIQLQQKGTSSFAESLADLCPQSLSTRAAQASFLLNVLLELRARLHANTVYSEDVWDEWTAERQDGVRNEEVDRQILFTWSDFLRDQRTSDEIVEVLWLAFPLKQGRTETVRVCDFLAAGNAPQGLLTHRVVVLSMVCVWKGGLKTEPEHSIASRYDSGATPRVIHTVEILIYTVYLGLLVHFVLAPSPSLRVLFLIVYSGSQLLKNWSFRSMPFLLVLLAFMNHVPSVPFPENFAYHTLLFTLSWHIIELHLPLTPSPLVYLPFQQVLPLAVLIWHGISRIFVPVVAFFLPAMLAALVMLSLSMRDILDITLLTMSSPAPMEARVAFVTLFSVMLLSLLSSLAMLVLTYPTFSQNPSVDPWNRYSLSIGVQARVALYRIVVSYAEPYVFPYPLNILAIISSIPSMVAAFMGNPDFSRKASRVKRIIWRISIGPLAWVVAVLWLWKRRG